MKRLALFVSLACVAVVVLGAARSFCHSQQFYLAKKKLDRMVLTPAQRAEILAFERDFQKKWRRTHEKLGCRAHEAHVDEFIAAAAGVLTDAQFAKFRGRERNRVEHVGYQVRQTGMYLDNLLKLADSL